MGTANPVWEAAFCGWGGYPSRVLEPGVGCWEASWDRRFVEQVLGGEGVARKGVGPGKGRRLMALVTPGPHPHSRAGLDRPRPCCPLLHRCIGSGPPRPSPDLALVWSGRHCLDPSLAVTPTALGLATRAALVTVASFSSQAGAGVKLRPACPVEFNGGASRLQGPGQPHSPGGCPSCALSVTQHNAFWVGDVVRVIDDLDTVKRLQAGHGEWTDDMAPVSASTHPRLPPPLEDPPVTLPSPHSGPGPHWEGGESFQRRQPACGSRRSAVDLQPLLPGGLPPRGGCQPGRGRACQGEQKCGHPACVAGGRQGCP